MKNIKWAIGCIGMAVLLFSSCLDSEEAESYSYVSLTSFSIEDITTYTTYVNSNGNDTTISTVVSGDYYPFTIDQLNGLVYNTDSLPMGTDVSHVLANITADGPVYYEKSGTDTLIAYSSSDSIDFTRPLRFAVISTDGAYYRFYTVNICVAQQDADSLVWKGLLQSNFPGNRIKGQKAVVFGSRLMVFGISALTGEMCVTSTALDDGCSWMEFTPVNGLSAAADYRSVTQLGDALYAIDNGALCRSTDGLQWENTGNTYRFDHLAGAVSPNGISSQLWAVSDGKWLVSTDGSRFVEEEVLPANFPDTIVSTFCYPLKTNAGINRHLLVGISSSGENQNSKISVWSKLSTESKWSNYTADEESEYICPLLEPLSIIYYDEKLFAFGGAGERGGKEKEPFESLFVSTDNGVSWEQATEKTMLPREFYGKTDDYSCAVDGSNRIWLMWSGKEGAVYQACLNRLRKMQ